MLTKSPNNLETWFTETYIFLTILDFTMLFSHCKYTKEEMCITLSIGFQNMAAWGQKKTTDHSDRKRKSANFVIY